MSKLETKSIEKFMNIAIEEAVLSMNDHLENGIPISSNVVVINKLDFPAALPPHSSPRPELIFHAAFATAGTGTFRSKSSRPGGSPRKSGAAQGCAF